jgi:hypothetical protein
MFSMLRNDLSDENEREQRPERPRAKPEDMIPCDLCGKNIGVSLFMQHQVNNITCVEGYTKYSLFAKPYGIWHNGPSGRLK